MAVMKIIPYFLFICFLIHLGCGEPHCSKFHYEEALLEKVVRLEFKLEQMEKGFKEMENAIHEERRKLHEESANAKAELEESKKESASKLKDMDNDVKLLRENLFKDVKDATSVMELYRQQNEAKLVRFSADMIQFENELLNNITSLIKVPDVFFKAKDLRSISVNSGQVFVFKTILKNEGEGYNTGSGIFTAPVDGDYLFTVQMCNKPNNDIDMTFVVDSIDQTPMAIRGSDYTCGTITLMSSLKTGARVWLKSKSSTTVHQDNNRSITFSGILLKI